MLRKLITLLALAIGGANAVTHIITVGANKTLAFNPSTLTASIGDSLEFHFFTGTGSHSVVSSSFSNPCQPSNSTSDNFFSGYITGDITGTPTFTVPITSLDAIWFYCSLGKHCPLGMVGVINPSEGDTVEAYVAAAKNGNVTVGAPSSVTGGVVGSGNGNATSTVVGSTSVSEGGSTVTTAPTTSVSTSTGGAGTVTATSGVVAATITSTPSAAGRSQDVSVVLGLIPVLGGLVALMA